VTINNTNGVTLGSARTVPTTLTLTNGTFTNGANLTLSNGATIVRDVGTLSAAPTFGTTVNVTYSGTTAVTSGNELPTSTTVLNNLTINKSGGVTLGASKTVNGALALTSGDLTTTGSYTLTMGSSATTTGDYDVVGTVRRASPTAGAKTYGSTYTSLNFASNVTGNVDVTLQKSLSGFTKYVNRQYSLTVPGGAGSAAVSLHYQAPGDLVGDPNEGALNLWRYDTGLSRWGLMGADARVSSGNASYVQKNSISTFSDWAIGEENPTAVTLSTFNAHADNASSGAILVLGLAVSGTFAVGAGWWLMRRRLA
jgi:hypothetical protein